MRDPLDAVGLVFARLHESQIPHAEVLHSTDDVGDVDEILRFVQNDHDHPTSSTTPNRPGSWRSPRSHTHPPPPLHTSRPTRRRRPGNISLTMRSKRRRPPAWRYAPGGPGMATVTQYPVSRPGPAPR